MSIEISQNEYIKLSTALEKQSDLLTEKLARVIIFGFVSVLVLVFVVAEGLLPWWSFFVVMAAFILSLGVVYYAYTKCVQCHTPSFTLAGLRVFPHCHVCGARVSAKTAREKFEINDETQVNSIDQAGKKAEAVQPQKLKWSPQKGAKDKKGYFLVKDKKGGLIYCPSYKDVYILLGILLFAVVISYLGLTHEWRRPGTPYLILFMTPFALFEVFSLYLGKAEKKFSKADNEYWYQGRNKIELQHIKAIQLIEEYIPEYRRGRWRVPARTSYQSYLVFTDNSREHLGSTFKPEHGKKDGQAIADYLDVPLLTPEVAPASA